MAPIYFLVVSHYSRGCVRPRLLFSTSVGWSVKKHKVILQFLSKSINCGGENERIDLKRCEGERINLYTRNKSFAGSSLLAETKALRTDRRTNRKDQPTDRRTDGRTHPLIESWLTTKNKNILQYIFYYFFLDSVAVRIVKRTD